MDDGTLIRDIRSRLFDEKGKVWLAPIRHHSPACSAALAAMIREIRPTQILIEGPEDYTRLIPDLLHPETQPPVAIAALVEHKDRPRIAAYFPLCAHSPEFVALKEGKAIPDLTQPLDVTSEINLRVPALLPNDYCPDVHERLTLYKRFANCEDEDSLRDLQEELIDRFGELPNQATSLLETHRLRLLSRPLGVTKLDAGEKSIQLQFCPKPPIEPIKIIQLIQSDRNFKLAGQDKLSWTKNTATLKERVAAIKELFKKLGS